MRYTNFNTNPKFNGLQYFFTLAAYLLFAVGAYHMYACVHCLVCIIYIYMYDIVHILRVCCALCAVCRLLCACVRSEFSPIDLVDDFNHTRLRNPDKCVYERVFGGWRCSTYIHIGGHATYFTAYLNEYINPRMFIILVYYSCEQTSDSIGKMALLN